MTKHSIFRYRFLSSLHLSFQSEKDKDTLIVVHLFACVVRDDHSKLLGKTWKSQGIRYCESPYATMILYTPVLHIEFTFTDKTMNDNN